MRNKLSSKKNAKFFLKKAFTCLFFLLFVFPSKSFGQDPCANTSLYYQKILSEVAKKNPNVVKDLPECFKQDRKLMIKIALIDPLQISYASQILKEDFVFFKRLIKVSPEVLQFASDQIRGSAYFMEDAIMINRESLKYATQGLLNNESFMRKMIYIDAYNYKFASDKIKEIPEIATYAFEDNGMLLEWATNKVKNNKALVKIAIKSNAKALRFASNNLQVDYDIKQYAQNTGSKLDGAELQKYLNDNYYIENSKKNVGKMIGNKAKFFGKNQIISRNYVTKWRKVYDYNRIRFGNYKEDWKLTVAEGRNFNIPWHEDFKHIPNLTKRIEDFFQKHNVNHGNIENLQTTFLWKIKDNPLTYGFNLYQLRESTDNDLGPEFANITSLTAIAQQDKNFKFSNKTNNSKRNTKNKKELENTSWKQGKWHLSVIEGIFDQEVRVNSIYENGHKKYLLWDLLLIDKTDRNPKIIFKVEDDLRDYFEIYEEQQNGKYQMVFRSE